VAGVCVGGGGLWGLGGGGGGGGVRVLGGGAGGGGVFGAVLVGVVFGVLVGLGGCWGLWGVLWGVGVLGVFVWGQDLPSPSPQTPSR